MAGDANVRAEIPALLSVEDQQRNKTHLEPQYQQRWGWRDGGRPKLSPNEVAEFVQTYAWPKETEMALQSLFKGGYDVPRAVDIIHEARREKTLKREEAERIHKCIFERAMDRHGKKLHLVKRRMGRTMTTREVVSKFYLWKKTPEYEQWHERQREKRRKREAKRLAHLRPAADQHNEYCETCVKGGKLLCCDGCERAYHLNCVRPALLDVPDGDWFCSCCRDAAPKTPLAKQRNIVNVPSPGSSRSPSRPKTRPDGSNLKGQSNLLATSQACDVEKKTVVKNLATKKSAPAASIKPNKISDHLSTDDLSPNDAISDITTESDSDGGAAKVFQALSPKYVVMRPLQKRKQQYVEVSIGRSRYASPLRSLEYLSNPPEALRKGVMPLQLESASSSRKRRCRVDAKSSTVQSAAIR
ncbi:hypothetical protein PRIC1_007787 [Phytophthora ramorum]